MISKICLFAVAMGLASAVPEIKQLPITKFTHIHTIQAQNDDSRATIRAKIIVKDELMDIAIKKSQLIVADAQKLVQQFCDKFFHKLDCENLFQVTQTNYEAQYEDQKRSLDFLNFLVENSIQFTVENDKQTIAALIDKLNLFGISKIQEVTQSQNDDEDLLEKAVQQGKKQCKSLCKNIGGIVKNVVAIEQQQQDDEDKVSVKFEVDCQILPPQVKPPKPSKPTKKK